MSNQAFAALEKIELGSKVQRENELMYSRQLIEAKIEEVLSNSPAIVELAEYGAQILEAFSLKDHGYESKNDRWAQLQGMNFEEVTMTMFAAYAWFQMPELYVSATSQLAARLNFDDRLDSIKSIAEMTALLSNTGVYEIQRYEEGGSMYIQSKVLLPEELIQQILQTRYLPPMVCQPEEITNNFQGSYLTHNDCMILGRGNAHDGDICLDVVNKANSVCLKLDEWLLDNVAEEPNKPFEYKEDQELWDAFMVQSREVYDLMLNQGNQFWLPHKPDKRGRLYALGYHINTQGSAWKKASIELYNEELVEGVF